MRRSSQQAQGALERDQNLLAEAQMDQKRYQDAWAKNAIPRQTLEDQEKVVLQDQGTVKNDEGTVQYDTGCRSAYCHITSPINGRVGLRLVDPGNLVTANSQHHSCWWSRRFSQSPSSSRWRKTACPRCWNRCAAARRSKSMPTTARNKAAGEGQAITIDNQIDTVTGTVKLRAQFDNRDGKLFPNEFVNTRLLVKTLDNQVLIPSSAIQHNGATAISFTSFRTTRPTMTTVKSGISDAGNTAVTWPQARRRRRQQQLSKS